MAMSRSRDGTWLTTRSPMRSRPLEISSRPATIRSAVVLPQPDGPTRTMNSPSSIWRLSELTAVVPSGYVFVTPSNVTPAIPSPPASVDRVSYQMVTVYDAGSPTVGWVASGAWTEIASSAGGATYGFREKNRRRT